MKKMLKALFAVALSVALIIPSTAAMAQTKNPVEVDIQAGNATASVVVDDNYNVTVEATKGTIDLNNVDVTVSMTDIEGLGIEGTREHSFSAGYNAQLNLDSILADQYVAQALDAVLTTTLKVNICDTKAFQYAISDASDGEYYRYVASARGPVAAAWAEASKHVATSTQSVDDSYVKLVAGSYIIAGGEKLLLEKDVTAETVRRSLIGELREAGTIVSTNEAYDRVEENEEFNKTVIPADEEIFVKAGTEVAVGNSVATLKNDMTITIQDLFVKKGAMTEVKNMTAITKDSLLSVVLPTLMSLPADEQIDVKVEFADVNVNVVKVGVEAEDVTLSSHYGFTADELAAKLAELEAVEGYEFKGYYADEACTKELTLPEIVEDGYTVYMKWEVKAENPDDEQKPGDDEQKPGDDEQKPGDDEQKPGDDEQKPGDDEQKPGDDEQKPEDTTKPEQKPSAPVTGDSSAVVLYAVLALAAVIVAFFARKRIAR